MKLGDTVFMLFGHSIREGKIWRIQTTSTEFYDDSNNPAGELCVSMTVWLYAMWTNPEGSEKPEKVASELFYEVDEDEVIATSMTELFNLLHPFKGCIADKRTDDKKVS